MCLLGISAPCHKIPLLINKIKLFHVISSNATEGNEYILNDNQNASSASTKKIVGDSTLPDTNDNSSLIVKSVQKDQSSNNHTSPKLPSNPEVDQIKEGPSSGMFPSNETLTLMENDQKCEQIFWDIVLECYRKKDPNCFTEPGLASSYKDCRIP